MEKIKEQQKLKLEHMLIIATIGLAPLLGNLDGSIVMIACPILEKVFQTNTAGVSMVMISYLLINAGFALIFGKLGDIKSPEKIFTAGFIVLTIGSLFCGLATNLNFLVAFRVVQALGSTMLFSTYCAVVVRNLPEEVRGRAFGFVGVLGSIGFAIGAPVGGLILKYLSWHWLFLFNIPFGVAGVLLARKYLINHKIEVEVKAPFDIWGGFLSLCCLLAFVYVLKQAPELGWGSASIIGLIAVSIICFALFIIREKRFSHPLVDIDIFKNINLSFAAMSALLVILLLNGVLFTFPYFLEIAKGLSAEKAGLMLMVLPIAVFACSPLAGYLVDKKSPRLIASIAAIFILFACILFILIKLSTPIWFILLAFGLFGISLAFFTVSNMTLVMSNAQEGKQGVISATLAVINSVGALMGVALFQLIFSQSIGMNIQGMHFISPENLTKGFNTAMFFAVALCIPALIFSMLIKKKQV